MDEDAKLITEIVRRVPMAPVLYADIRKATHKRTWPCNRIHRALHAACDQGLLVRGQWKSSRRNSAMSQVSYTLPPSQ